MLFRSVSHDRYFVSKTANKIWEISEGKIKIFKGDYKEYLEWKERMQGKEAEAKKDIQVKEKQEIPPAKVTPVQNNMPVNKELKKEWARCQKNLQQLEEQLKEIRERMSKLEEMLSDPSTYSDKEKFSQTETAYAAAQKESEIGRAHV